MIRVTAENHCRLHAFAGPLADTHNDAIGSIPDMAENRRRHIEPQAAEKEQGEPAP